MVGVEDRLARTVDAWVLETIASEVAAAIAASPVPDADVRVAPLSSLPRGRSSRAIARVVWSGSGVLVGVSPSGVSRPPSTRRGPARGSRDAAARYYRSAAMMSAPTTRAALCSPYLSGVSREESAAMLGLADGVLARFGSSEEYSEWASSAEAEWASTHDALLASGMPNPAAWVSALARHEAGHVLWALSCYPGGSEASYAHAHAHASTMGLPFTAKSLTGPAEAFAEEYALVASGIVSGC